MRKPNQESRPKHLQSTKKEETAAPSPISWVCECSFVDAAS